MNKQLKTFTYLLVMGLCLGLAHSARATVTGQWDFKTGYNATIGTPISAEDSTTAPLTLFESTTAFGISSIGGQATNVMFFPQATDDNGGFDYQVPVGAAPNDTNDGGYLVNQYTVIMDVLFTNLPTGGKTFTLFGTDSSFETGLNTGEFFVNSSGAVGCSSGAGGHITTNVWHRVAIAVDAENASSGLEIFIDGTNVLTAAAPSAVNGEFAIESDIFLFDDLETNSEPGFIASLQFDDVQLPAGDIAELGAPVAAGILAGPPPTPYTVSISPLSDLELPALSTVSASPLIQIVLTDGTATVATNTIVLKFDGSNVTPTVSYSAPTTTISYQVPTVLLAGSLNTVVLNYQDTASDNLGVQWSFDTQLFVSLPSSAAGALGTASTPGFIYRVAEATIASSGAGSEVQAQELLDGTFRNSSGVAYANEANLSTNGGTGFTNNEWFIDEYETNNGTVAFSSYQPSGYAPPGTYIPPEIDIGNGGSLADTLGGTMPFVAYSFPGIPGAEASGGTTNYNFDNFADDILAYLPLTAGVHTFGVATFEARTDVPPDNGYVLYCAPNPRDFFATPVGRYARNAPSYTPDANTNYFTFLAPSNAVYPFRLVHWAPAPASGGSEPSILVWFYVDPATGTNILINDPLGTVPAYRVSTIPREPYVAEISPLPGGAGFAAAEPIVVILGDDDLKVATNSISLYLNNVLATASIAQSNSLTTVTINPDPSRTNVTNNVELIYSDNATPTPNSFTNSWSFTIVPNSTAAPPVTGQWDFNGNLNATVGSNLLFFDGSNGYSASAMTFGTCSSFGIPPINGQDVQVIYVPALLSDGSEYTNRGISMFHGIAPNGGGALVNQYTIIWDMYVGPSASGVGTNVGSSIMPFFQCQNTNNPSNISGSLYLQNGDMGQGSGGYVMNHGAITPGWHRMAFAANLTSNTITKWVDGVKAQDWVSSANSLDQPRRAWQQEVILFASPASYPSLPISLSCYVSSIQVRSGKVSDADMVLLGGASPGKIPQQIPATSVTGQWDFNFDTTNTLSANFDGLAASVGSNLLFFDGTNGYSASAMTFGTCSAFGIPSINGVDAQVMYVPALLSNGSEYTNRGISMFHGIAPNGGGALVNQYTIIWDMYVGPSASGVGTNVESAIMPFFQCQNTNNPSNISGSLYLQNGQMGQGSGGYLMYYPAGNTAGNGQIQPGWHRIAFAADLSQNLVTKWVDGEKADDWVSSANSLDTPRRAWQPEVILFASPASYPSLPISLSCYVKSIQVSSVKLSDAQMEALGGPSPYGIPLAVPTITATPNGAGLVTLSWPTAFQGYVLYGTTNLLIPMAPVSGVDYLHNTYQGEGQFGYFQLLGNTNTTSGGLGYEPGLQ